MPQIITVDEWIVHYLNDKNTVEAIYDFLLKVEEICDSFICLKGSPLAQKIWKLSSTSSNFVPSHQAIIKYFFNTFIWNSKKFHFVDDVNLDPLPSDIEQDAPPSDKYLVQTALSTNDKTILTTDEALKEDLSKYGFLTIYLVKDFVPQYKIQSP
jgi:hypothetical protein